MLNSFRRKEKLQAGYKQIQDTKAAETLTSGADQILNSEKTITDGINTLQGKDNANAQHFSVAQVH